MNHSLLFYFLILLFVSCDINEKENEKINAVVYKVEKTHEVYGYFLTKVYYKFNYNNKQYYGRHKYRYERSYTIQFEDGDSVLINFSKIDPSKNSFERISYDKSKQVKLK